MGEAVIDQWRSRQILGALPESVTNQFPQHHDFKLPHNPAVQTLDISRSYADQLTDVRSEQSLIYLAAE